MQESLAQSHGSQCGFCTPGFIMSMYALLRSSQTPPSEEQIEESLAGNCAGALVTDQSLMHFKSLQKLTIFCTPMHL